MADRDLDRGLGLSCDNLISADVVTADGRLLQASDQENQDLFWALRGGSGNFGVVTSFKYQLSPVKDIFGGPMFFELDRAGDVLRFYRDFIADAPEQLGLFAGVPDRPPVPFIPEDRQGEAFVAFVSCWTGPLSEGTASCGRYARSRRSWRRWSLRCRYPALNGMFDALVPPGLQHYWKANFASELTDAAIEGHCEHGPKVRS